MHPADPNRSRNRSRPLKNKPDTNNKKKKGGLGRSFRTTSFQEDGSAAVPYNSRRETGQARETERERERESFLLSGMESGGGATRYCRVCGGAERELGKKVGLFLFSLSLSLSPLSPTLSRIQWPVQLSSLCPFGINHYSRFEKR